MKSSQIRVYDGIHFTLHQQILHTKTINLEEKREITDAIAGKSAASKITPHLSQSPDSQKDKINLSSALVQH